MNERFAEVVKQADVNRVFGEITEAEGRILIPLTDIRYGLDSSLDSGDRGAIEVGPATMTRPLGYIEIDSDGTRIAPVVDHQKVALVALLFAVWSVLWIAWAVRAAAKSK